MNSTANKIGVAVFLLGILAFPLQTWSQNDKSKVQSIKSTSSTEVAENNIPLKAEDISPILIGEKIPAASLLDQYGNMIDLNRLISEKPAILIFYRGGWCPYCSRQLSGLQKISDNLRVLGYQLIAVSTDNPNGLMDSKVKEGLSYTLLSDADLSAAKKFGIAYKAPKEYLELLPKTTEGKNRELLLPVPSVFILSRDGIVNFEYINPNITQRLKPQLLEIVAKTLINDL